MAYVNVAEWKTDQVCEWLKGLDNSVLPYVHSFSNHNVNGQQLLNLRPEDLDHLGVIKLGHQETILEAVEYLRNFHYELDRENLQLLSLRLSCLTHSLFNELSRQTDLQPVSTQTLADVATIVSAVKPLVCWLDRPPFSGQLEYNDKKGELLKLSLEMATCAQRDRFAEKPIEEIRTTCGQMAKLADYIVQDIADPMILQPASLDLATLKKRPGDDLGFCILPSFHGAHQIAEIKFGSAAHQCGKMEEGDEIVQVNYQTVVGWERKNVLELFRESPAEVLLTLKRRPRHTKVYGQIYIKPYRLPSNKKTPYASRWHHNLPSPRPELLTIPDFTMPLPKQQQQQQHQQHQQYQQEKEIPKEINLEHKLQPTIIDTVDMMIMTTDDSSGDSDLEIEPTLSSRLYLAKPRNLVQRRATITGASPTTKHSIDIERFWRELKNEHNSTFQLRDKAASCAHGLNNVQSNSNNSNNNNSNSNNSNNSNNNNLRPQTCLGIEIKRHGKIDERRVQFNEHNDKVIDNNCDNNVPFERNSLDSNFKGDDNNEKEIENEKQKLKLKEKNEMENEKEKNKMENEKERNKTENEKERNKMKNEKEEPRRGELEKSHSTPAYDFNFEIEENFGKKANDNFPIQEEVKIIVGSVVKKINDIEKHLMKSSEKIFSPKCEKSSTSSSSSSSSSCCAKNEVIKNEKYSPPKVIIQKDDFIILNKNENTTEINVKRIDNKEIKMENNPKKIDNIQENNKNQIEIFEENRENQIENFFENNKNQIEIYKDNKIENSKRKIEITMENRIENFEENSKKKIEIENIHENKIENLDENKIENFDDNSKKKIELLTNNKEQKLKIIEKEIKNQEKIDNFPLKKNSFIVKQKKLCPPEPPPRKYFSKSLNLIKNNQEKPKIPDRRKNEFDELESTKKEEEEEEEEQQQQQKLKENEEYFHNNEKKRTMEFHDNSLDLKNSTIDSYGYSEIYDFNSDEKYDEKYQLFTDKFSNSSTIDSKLLYDSQISNELTNFDLQIFNDSQNSNSRISNESRNFESRIGNESRISNESKNLESRISNESRTIDSRISNESRNFNSRISNELKNSNSRFSNESKNLESRIGNESRNLESRIGNESRNLESRIGNESRNLESRIGNESRNLESRISNESRNLESRISNESRNLESRIGNESRNLESRISNDSRNLESRISNESRTIDSRISNESRNYDLRISNELKNSNSRIFNESRTIDSRISNESRTIDSRISNESRTIDSRISNESRTIDSRISNESRASNDSRNSMNDSRISHDGKNYDSRIFGESRTLDSRLSNESRTISRMGQFDGKYFESRTLDSRLMDTRDLQIDSTDGACCSKFITEKPRTLEKDRGVMNRAMMVAARSIGFNASASKILTSPKNSRKRNIALAKRRNISVKELSPVDLEGWLIYRSRGAGGAWAKAWFVLKGASLFRFKLQDSIKADCLIALAGFTASQAQEVKSRKYAFKIYHTGTVFYFAADTEDSLLIWLDAVSKTTIGADPMDRSSGLFSETDESDGEMNRKLLKATNESKENSNSSSNNSSSSSSGNKGFGSLKKIGKKGDNYKEQNLPTGASLDRKYLKFLGKSQNVPVPTAQFRSYRRVLPSSTPRKQDLVSHSPELPVTVSGSTFYGLNASRSANDVPSSSQDMGDYRRTSDRFPRSRRNDELQGFITLEEFMLSRQDEDHQRGTPSPRFTPLTSDHVHIQHRTFDNFENGRMNFVRDIPNNNGVIYGFPKNYDENSLTNGGNSYLMQTQNYTFERRSSEKTRDSCEAKNSTPRTLNCMRKKKIIEDPYYDSRQDNRINEQQNRLTTTTTTTNSPRTGAHGQINPANYGCEFIGNEFRAERNNSMDLDFSRRIAKNDVYSGSSGDLASLNSTSDTFKMQKTISVSRNGSFNLADCRREKNNEKKLMKFDKNKLKHVGQYQPPPIFNTPFEQEGMRAAFEMHLDKNDDVQKKNKLKNFFTNKSPQKPIALEIPKETQKTILGSPRLHRALFRDKSSTQPKIKRSGSQSPGDSGISQSLSSGSASQSQTLSQSYSSVSSVSDWSPDAPAAHGSKCPTNHPGCQKRSTNSRNFTSPPTLPYIPPPTSPPPDYPGLEYPPVFEPGTYSLSDASSILRNRNNKNS
ncbi:probable serine/threonine-protein kinase DDB_G0282963 [Leptopilina boulardi]|uniref:probable serine/threonine-protein kinase DDB_G0282963 n=1 Tax=Leptopilina boulardi TaxID=63433 RepID=UPI0021F56BC2|nr:probable serine/threonine-protein kinase DDB_G0282963 [Leptopilina boulardi]